MQLQLNSIFLLAKYRDTLLNYNNLKELQVVCSEMQQETRFILQAQKRPYIRMERDCMFCARMRIAEG